MFISRNFKYVSKLNILYRSYTNTNFNYHLNNKIVKTSFINQINKRYKTYLPNNEWISEDNGIYKIGIDKEGAEKMGQLVYIDFNLNPDDVVNQDQDIVFLESVKAVESIKAPFDCLIIENNEEIVDNLSSINENSECEQTSWIVKFKRDS